ncbi:MAG: PqiC family protein [Kiloniellales bacterium]|nr:PqiC family protein [Kiloniellales bacterium]
MIQTTSPRHAGLLAVLVLSCILAACAESQPSRFYLLSSLPPAEAGESAKPLSVGVGPISMPEYLNRPQIVTRDSSTKLALAEFDRWGEPLDELFSQAMAANLSALLKTERVYRLPRRRTASLDYQVEIDIFRFDAEATGLVQLTARWSLYGKGGKKLLKTGTANLTEQAGPTPEDLAEGMSRVVERFSRNIAGEIGSRRG